MTDKVIGVIVAGDEADYIKIVLNSMVGLVDEIIFADDASDDETVEVVRRCCDSNGIPHHILEFKSGVKRRILWEAAKDIVNKMRGDGTWIFIVDPNVVIKDAGSIRSMISDEYDEYCFKSINLVGDLKSGMVGYLNSPIAYLLHTRVGVIIDERGYHATGECRINPDSEHFIGWNIGHLQYADHIFQEYQRWFTFAWNKKYGMDQTVSEFLCNFFNTEKTGEPSESYMKTFVLNRLRYMCMPVSEASKSLGMTKDDFYDTYLRSIPSEIVVAVDGFELKFDETGEVTGRSPDLMATPVLDDDRIYQLANMDLYRGWLDE